MLRSEFDRVNAEDAATETALCDVVGDAFIAAAFLCYAGPLDVSARRGLVRGLLDRFVQPKRAAEPTADQSQDLDASTDVGPEPAKVDAEPTLLPRSLDGFGDIVEFLLQVVARQCPGTLVPFPLRHTPSVSLCVLHVTIEKHVIFGPRHCGFWTVDCTKLENLDRKRRHPLPESWPITAHRCAHYHVLFYLRRTPLCLRCVANGGTEVRQGLAGGPIHPPSNTKPPHARSSRPSATFSWRGGWSLRRRPSTDTPPPFSVKKFQSVTPKWLLYHSGCSLPMPYTLHRHRGSVPLHPRHMFPSRFHVLGLQSGHIRVPPASQGPDTAFETLQFWKACGLALSEGAIGNALIATQGLRTPFVVDPEGLFGAWARKALPSVLHVSGAAGLHGDRAAGALQYGNTLLVDGLDAHRPVPAALCPVIEQSFMRHRLPPQAREAGAEPVALDGQLVPMDLRFRLVLTGAHDAWGPLRGLFHAVEVSAALAPGPVLRFPHRRGGGGGGGALRTSRSWERLPVTSAPACEGRPGG